MDKDLELRVLKRQLDRTMDDNCKWRDDIDKLKRTQRELLEDLDFKIHVALKELDETF
jgi:hypothetical protein